MSKPNSPLLSKEYNQAYSVQSLLAVSISDDSNNINPPAPLHRFLYVQVADSSMSPTINQYDIIEVDTKIKYIECDGFYYLKRKKHFTHLVPDVRRIVIRIMGGGVCVRADNPLYADMGKELSLEQFNELYEIVGRIKRFWVESSRLKA